MWDWDYVANEMDIIYLIRKKNLQKAEIKEEFKLNYTTDKLCILIFSMNTRILYKKNLYSQKQPNEDIRK